MKTLYLDCGMGAAGDMLTAALLELVPDPEGFLARMNALGLPGVAVRRETAVKCGITGTHVTVTVDGAEEASHDHPHEHEHEHGHDHEHNHEHSHDHEHEHEHDHEHDHEHGHDHEHDHEHDHDHDHGHDHDHEHPHPHEHEHSHEHGHEHDHEHEHSHDHGHDQDHDHSHPHGHHHSSMAEIRAILAGLDLPEAVRADVEAVYGRIAEAESRAHGVPVTDIHFHEVGTLDAMADITAVCLLLHELAPEEIVVSPVHVGSGQVRCAHGVLPVPAPATAYLLQNAPIYGGSVRGELCTPTGAALLTHFATRFGEMPVMRTQAIGYGMGKKDFEAANCVRALLGETEGQAETVYSLSCNVDDMTAEAVGFALERFFESGALDAYTVPIGMKKSRPGTLIQVLCRREDREALAACIFRHTTTLGIRTCACGRYVLDRTVSAVDTPYGPVRRKDAQGYGVTRSKYEYEDLARIARERGIGLAEARDLVERT